MKTLIAFTAYDIDFTLPHSSNISNWLHQVILSHQRELSYISFIFCTDSYLLSLNQKYLDHDYFTDILTFPYHDMSTDPIQSDIFISIERVQDNANTYQVSFEDELHRVMAHGVLHLLGFDDHSEAEKQLMREQEEKALAMRSDFV